MANNEKENFVKNLKDGYITIKLQIYEKRIRQDKHSKEYIELKMGDRTGTTTVRLFFEQTQVQNIFDTCHKGDVLKLEGQYSDTYKSLSVNDPTKVYKCTPDDYRPEDFRCTCDKEPQVLMEEIKITIDNMQNTHLKTLLETIFNDTKFVSKFMDAPSAMSMHHNYAGGNLEHTVGVLKICKQISELYEVDADLLFCGAILHDIGKIRTYTFDKSMPTITDEERMISHVIVGDRMVHETINKTFQDFPEDLKMQLSHLMLSHHGKNEWGSPVSPETPEAIALHYADLLDSQVKKALQRNAQ
ncbi:MAG: HD domain-containing protein [Candidatus Bathyarchaeia archaeon]|jgi:3'-5' exoribonuclease